jgi:hypothetical protein
MILTVWHATDATTQHASSQRVVHHRLKVAPSPARRTRVKRRLMPGACGPARIRALVAMRGRCWEGDGTDDQPLEAAPMEGSRPRRACRDDR